MVQHRQQHNSRFISVGAQSTLREGQDIFARKYVHEKLTKCPNCTWYLPEKLTKFPNFTWFLPEQYFSRFFFLGGGGQMPPAPPSPTPMIRFTVGRLLSESQSWDDHTRWRRRHLFYNLFIFISLNSFTTARCYTASVNPLVLYTLEHKTTTTTTTTIRAFADRRGYLIMSLSRG